MKPPLKSSSSKSFFSLVLSFVWECLTSVKLTVLYLFILFVLVAFGTFYQIDYGLHAAQQKFFYSWIILVFDFIPFPGAQTIMWLISISIFCNSFKNFKWRLKKLGILLLHFGVLFLLMGAFFVHYFSKESFLALQEGEIKNTTESYHSWEIAFWEKGDSALKTVQAYTIHSKSIGENFTFTLPKTKTTHTNQTTQINKTEDSTTNIFSLKVANYYRNSLIIEGGSIYPHRLEKEVEKNQPALFLQYSIEEEKKEKAQDKRSEKNEEIKTINTVLVGDLSLPLTIKIDNREFSLSFRRERLQFPFKMKLIDFKKELYYQTETPKSYESSVEIVEDQQSPRETRIYMNNPLRMEDYTFYQSSFIVDPQTGQETSVFSVVKNSFRLFPYISSGIVTLGLVLHFCLMFFLSIQNRKN